MHVSIGKIRMGSLLVEKYVLVEHRNRMIPIRKKEESKKEERRK